MFNNDSSAQQRWHAVFCKPRQDERAEQHLRHQGFTTFRPKTRAGKTRRGRQLESMFPRYLFVRLSVRGQDWTPIRSTRGAIGLVRHGAHAATVPESIIRDLRRRCDENDVVELAGAIDYQPGDNVEVIDGPCAGHRALFEARTGAERVAVLLTILNRQRRIELPEHAIRRA